MGIAQCDRLIQGDCLKQFEATTLNQIKTLPGDCVYSNIKR